MTAFLNPVDIANRALQHCGANRIDASLGFSENSRNSAETYFVYDKLRRAELRRNVWRFAIRDFLLRPIDTTFMLLSPAMWVSTVTYFVGSIVSDQSGNLWISNTPNNLGNDPLLTNAWDSYFGPMAVGPYDSSLSYVSGELVYTTDGDGKNRVYLSLLNGNTDAPSTATAWDATVTYKKNDVVTRSSVAYMSRVDLNLNNDPATTAFADWSSASTYFIGDKVSGSDGSVYQSVTNNNTNNDPVADIGTNWTNTGVLCKWNQTFVGGSGSVNWRQIGGTEFPNGVTLSELNILYPIGTGPVSQADSWNIFRLPAGFLRKAPRDPKSGSVSWIGAPTNLVYDDWTFQGHYIKSRETNSITLRFIADVIDVQHMDDMFCEGLAARIALEVCETLTQSIEKLGGIKKMYDEFMTDARTVNAIEVGSEEPPLDDFIACRM